MKHDIDFEILNKQDQIPYDLLLLADQTIDAINKYLFDSTIYVGRKNKDVIGVFCLYKIDNQTMELKNIAIKPEFQNQGYGSIFMDFIKGVVKGKYHNLIVGTPDIATLQINFYQKNGFVKFDTRKDFFVENYQQPIFENDIQLKDMVLLKYAL